MPSEDDLDESTLLEADSLEEDGSQEGNEETESADAQIEGHEEGYGRQDEAQEGRSGRVASRPNDTFRSLRERAQAAERNAAEAATQRQALERQLAEFRRQPDPAALARQAQEEAERVALMSQPEMAQYYANKTAQAVSQQIAQMAQRQSDSLDSMDYRGLMASNPYARKFEARVEELVREQAAQGFHVKREQALKFAVGEAVMGKASSAAAKQKPAAAGRVAAATVARGAATGDVAGDRAARGGNSKAALEARLKDVLI